MPTWWDWEKSSERMTTSTLSLSIWKKTSISSWKKGKNTPDTHLLTGLTPAVYTMLFLWCHSAVCVCVFIFFYHHWECENYLGQIESSCVGLHFCRNKLFPESVVRNMTFQILQGLSFIHEHGRWTQTEEKNWLCCLFRLLKCRVIKPSALSPYKQFIIEETENKVECERWAADKTSGITAKNDSLLLCPQWEEEVWALTEQVFLLRNKIKSALLVSFPLQ